jgi:hypothetical protein
MPWAVVGAVAGGLISANASGDAADTAAGAAEGATALQKYIFDQQTALQKPWLNAGNEGLNKLGYLLGLSPSGFGGGTGSMSTGSLETADQIRARLSGAYTTTARGPMTSAGGGGAGDGAAYGPDVVTVDTARLDAAVQAEMAKQQRDLRLFQQQSNKASKTDPAYGSLLDTFGMDNFKADPGYAFRKSEGEQALQRQLSAGGKYYSGAAMKDMARFSQGLASQEYGAAFDRFNVGQTNQFNRLASISGVGQTAANQTGAAGQNYANQAGANMIGAGNAQAAGAVGQANAWNNAIGQGVSAYQQNQLMNSLQPQTPSYYGGNGGGSGNYNYGGGY